MRSLTQEVLNRKYTHKWKRKKKNVMSAVRNFQKVPCNTKDSKQLNGNKEV